VSLGVYPVADSYALLARVGLTGMAAAVALYGAAVLDLVFGLGVLILRDRRWLWRAQMALIALYSVIIAIWLPEQWAHPYGPMTKNLPLFVAILLLHEFDEPGYRKE
ncbi:MAG TPA: DoxX-like family protein, partial [Burkholderiales bacterium]|nr:DoxX-like family protein [Burkholderiales bacterium]